LPQCVASKSQNCWEGAFPWAKEKVEVQMVSRSRRQYFFIGYKVIDFVGRINLLKTLHKKSHPEGWLDLNIEFDELEGES
jgi:hypothetical protein